MFLNNHNQAKNYFVMLEERLALEDNVENKMYGIKELFKFLFNSGVLKLKQKKSALEEIDSIKKDVGLSPILMIQSKLNTVFNNIVKGIDDFKF